MTADIELLPLPPGAEVIGGVVVATPCETLEDYVRANIEHHTSAQVAKIEKLRAALKLARAT